MKNEHREGFLQQHITNLKGEILINKYSKIHIIINYI